MGLNDNAWEALFEKYHILDAIALDGCCPVSASQIKEFREPRLMTKFDHQTNLPRIFAEHHLAVLPVTRGDYLIAAFEAYERLEEPVGKAQKIHIPCHLQSFIPQFLSSEAIALNCAAACGILEDFLEDEHLVPTVSGRMGSGAFDFQINTFSGIRTVSVRNAQIEIDAAYEGVRCLSLFEAKKDLSADFLVRQLYYPLRVWGGRVTKPVRPVFLVFSNGAFHLYEYQFENSMHYNSLRLIKQKSYTIETDISIKDLENLLNTVGIVEEPRISFPQANSMSRIVNLMELLCEKTMTRNDITSEYAFDERQTNYYTDAGRYLGLIEKTRDESGAIRFALTAPGKTIMAMDLRERQLAFARRILEHQVFHEVLRLALRCGELPGVPTVVPIMKRCGLYHIDAESTYVRRASTILGWIQWILQLLNG